MNLTSYKKKAMKQLESYRDALPEMPEMPDLSDLPDEKIARGLGWVSIALGIGGIAAPRQIERMLGLEEGNGQTTGVIRAVGVRELCHGIDILSQTTRRPASGPASRGTRSTGCCSGSRPERRATPWLCHRGGDGRRHRRRRRLLREAPLVPIGEQFFVVYLTH